MPVTGYWLTCAASDTRQPSRNVCVCVECPVFTL
jgi:hypothetical protein